MEVLVLIGEHWIFDSSIIFSINLADLTNKKLYAMEISRRSIIITMR